MQENRKNSYLHRFTQKSVVCTITQSEAFVFFNFKSLFAQEMNSTCTCTCLNFYSRCRIRFSNDAGTLYNTLEI